MAMKYKKKVKLNYPCEADDSAYTVKSRVNEIKLSTNAREEDA